MTHIVLSKKKIKLRLNYVVLLKTFIEKLYVLNHIVLSSILHKFPRKAQFFSLFSPKAVFFFSIYTILNKFESGTIRADPYCPFKKNDQFLSKAHMVRITLYFPIYLEILDQDIIQYQPYCPFKNFI